MVSDRRPAGPMKAVRRLPFLAAAFFPGFSSLALADSSGSDYGHGTMMNGWGWAGMVIGPIMMIAVLATIVIVAVLVVRWLGGGSRSPAMGRRRSGRDALDILEERFAKGEIDKDEFEQRRRVLGD